MDSFSTVAAAQEIIHQLNAKIAQANLAARMIADEHMKWIEVENQKRKPNFEDLSRLYINIVKNGD